MRMLLSPQREGKEGLGKRLDVDSVQQKNSSQRAWGYDRLKLTDVRGQVVEARKSNWDKACFTAFRPQYRE